MNDWVDNGSHSTFGKDWPDIVNFPLWKKIKVLSDPHFNEYTYWVQYFSTQC